MPVEKETSSRFGQRSQAFRRSDAEIAVGVENRSRWRIAYEEVRRRHLAGESLAAIGRATGLARGTVRKYAYAETAPERGPYGPGPSRLDPHLAYLENRMAEGCEDARALWREVRVTRLRWDIPAGAALRRRTPFGAGSTYLA